MCQTSVQSDHDCTVPGVCLLTKVDSRCHVPGGSDIPPAAGGGAGGSASCSGRQAGTSLREAVTVEKINMNGNFHSRSRLASFFFHHKNDQKVSNPTSRNAKKIVIIYIQKGE